jgi:hypothetical protein
MAVVFLTTARPGKPAQVLAAQLDDAHRRLTCLVEVSDAADFAADFVAWVAGLVALIDLAVADVSVVVSGASRALPAAGSAALLAAAVHPDLRKQWSR